VATRHHPHVATRESFEREEAELSPHRIRYRGGRQDCWPVAIETERGEGTETIEFERDLRGHVHCSECSIDLISQRRTR